MSWWKRGVEIHSNATRSVSAWWKNKAFAASWMLIRVVSVMGCGECMCWRRVAAARVCGGREARWDSTARAASVVDGSGKEEADDQGARVGGVCKMVLPDGVRSMGYAARSTGFNVFVFKFRD